MKRLILHISLGAALCILLAFGALQGWYGWYAASHPLDLSRLDRRGSLILDRAGSYMHMFAAKDGIFRLKADISHVDPRYIRTLVAFEDKRFYNHGGIDYLALFRATAQAIKNGRVISGGSTLTMQVARLLEPRPRTWQSKLIEMARAAQLEDRFSKQDILNIYLTLAPYGGAYEGVRAASWHYFGREPKDMTWGEAALLTVLPQSPSRFRPDRHPAAAAMARDKVLARVQGALGISKADLAANEGDRLRLSRNKKHPVTAYHLAFRLKDRKDDFDTVKTTLMARYQGGATDIINRAVNRLAPGMTAAAVIMDSRTGEIIAYVGSPDYFNEARAGAVDMVRAIRSPGSTLKPFIYGMGFDDGFLHPLTLIRDEKVRFGDYAPTNFRDRFHGEISILYALQHSLNIPAVKVLSRVGAQRFAAKLALAHVPLDIPGDQGAGLALALGGAGISLEDLVRLYGALAGDGHVRPERLRMADKLTAGAPLISPTARSYLQRILKGVAPPADLMPASLRQKGRRIAFKTGTSWGFRDALAIGFDDRWVIGVWIGKADGTPNPGHYGAKTAAPILFDLFAMMPKNSPREIRPREIRVAESDKVNWQLSRLSPLQRHFDQPPLKRYAAISPPPVIQFPVPDSQIKLPKAHRPVYVEATGGTGNLSLLVNGEPVAKFTPQGHVWWQPDGVGFHHLTIVDEAGRSVGTDVRILP
ncbi:MAG TPA: penicillin-binding protein 1C [Sphingomonadales bacterium]|nr:penicillin-binding protein 1C [Sphingomonadales bacterium]